MTREEYEKRLFQTPDWTPGWDAIVEQLEHIYGGGCVQYVDASRYPEENSPLEGFGVVPSPNGYMHIITRGLSNIHANLDVFGCVLSGWGFELTMKWPAQEIESCAKAFHILSRLAAYAHARRIMYRNYRSFSLRKVTPAPTELPDSFAGVMFVPDTELKTMETPHGRVQFLQVVNLTANELKRLGKFPGLTRQIAFGMARDDNSHMRIDENRCRDYLE